MIDVASGLFATQVQQTSPNDMSGSVPPEEQPSPEEQKAEEEEQKAEEEEQLAEEQKAEE